jgi:hypothetical protein
MTTFWISRSRIESRPKYHACLFGPYNLIEYFQHYPLGTELTVIALFVFAKDRERIE